MGVDTLIISSQPRVFTLPNVFNIDIQNSKFKISTSQLFNYILKKVSSYKNQ